MGACSSEEAAHKDPKETVTTANHSKRLLDYYNVGEMIGQGAFGVVYACEPIGSKGNQLAVKMVDKAETPADKIKEEVVMMQKMDHSNVIKCFDVFYEKCFICIVMNRLNGGDLIVGMQAHWKSKGKIPVMSTIQITAQMCAAIAYLHSRNIVHRDIKGDNYLCDRPNIVDPECKLVLTDFGTVVDCTPTTRLHEKCGTKLYWPPEFYKLDYSLKVDIWAMGVICYGLLNGKFPFRDEKEVNQKQVNVPKGTPPECEEFVHKVLEKKEDRRADYKELQTASWIAAKVKGGSVDDKNAPEENADGEVMREQGANQGIQERRNELVERLQESKKEKKPAARAHYYGEWFSLVDRRAKNSTLMYNWWSKDKVEKLGVLNLEGAKLVNEGQNTSSATTEVIERQLKSHNINTDAFGQGVAKSLQQMAGEVQHGVSVLMLDAAEHKKLVRVVDVVLLRICAPGSKSTFLMEIGEKYADGRERSIRRLPGTKKEPHMNSKQVAEKIASELLNLGGAKLVFDFSVKEIFEEQEESPSYPGVMTVYRKEIIQAFMQGDPSQNYIGKSPKGPKDWFHQDATGNTKYFAWMTDSDCAKNDVQYKAPTEGEEVSGLVQAPIGLEENELRRYFEVNKVDISKFGQGAAKSLADISVELIKGESCLMQDTDGSVLRVVDVVVLKLIHSVTGSILVQTKQTFPDNTTVTLNRLPGAKRRADENQFLTARRILKRQLKIEENHVTLDAANVEVAEEEKESLAYPGLRTIYRKRIITANLAKNDA